MFKEYKRIGKAECEPWCQGYNMNRVSISTADLENGSPKLGDMIARNPVNHADKWLIAAEYFKNNFKIAQPTGCNSCIHLTSMGACTLRAGDTNYIVPKFLQYDGCNFHHN